MRKFITLYNYELLNHVGVFKAMRPPNMNNIHMIEYDHYKWYQTWFSTSVLSHNSKRHNEEVVSKIYIETIKQLFNIGYLTINFFLKN